MNTFKSRLQYLIDLTIAYKEGYITNDEYKEIRAREVYFIYLDIAYSKIDEIILKTAALWSSWNQINVILIQQKNRIYKLRNIRRNYINT
jgi:hypothetical protein